MEQPGGEHEQGMGMKRPAEEDYNSNVHAKRSRDENGDGGPQLTLRFLLQSKDAGGIIGKAGSNVKRLRSEVGKEFYVLTLYDVVRKHSYITFKFLLTNTCPAILGQCFDATHSLSREVFVF